MASWKIGQPGMYYDEVLFGNAAIGGKTNDFIVWRISGIPFLLMDYIGALKAWIYYPIFSIFPVNYWSIRFPTICFGIAGGIALVAALWRGFGKNTALVGSIMILLDPTLLVFSRIDFGPNALMFFFRGIIIFSIVSFIKTEKIKWAWIALLASILGVFDKLNFIWFVGGVAPALVIVYYNQLKNNIVGFKRIQLLLIFGLGIALIIAAFKRGISLQQAQTPVIISWAERMHTAFGLLRGALGGGGALDFIAHNGSRLERWIWPGYFVTFFAALYSIKYLFKQKDKQRLFIFMSLTVLFVTGAFIITKAATGPHHSAMVSGLWQLALAPIIGAALDNEKQAQKRILGFLVKIGLVMIYIGGFVANIICINAFAKPLNKNWDTANATAALFAKQHPEADFISTDWGIGTQVILVTRDHPGISDDWPSFTTQQGAEDIIGRINRNKDTYIYTMLPGFENFKGNRNNLLAALHKDNINYQVVETYNNVFGQPIIQILYIRALMK